MSDELDARIAALPRLGADDPAYLVFADWLQSHGHAWGELIVMQSRLAPAQIDDWLAAHGAALLGGLGTATERPLGTVALRGDWHLGFLRTATLETPADANTIATALRALRPLPLARKLDGVVIVPVVEDFTTFRDWELSEQNVVDPWTDLASIVRELPDNIAHLGLGGWPAPPASAYVRMPDLDDIRIPSLRHLELTGAVRARPGRLDLRELTRLDVRFGRATADGLAAIAASTLPALDRLGVWLGGGARCILDDAYPPEELEYDDNGERVDPDARRYPAGYGPADLASLDVGSIRSDVTPDQLRAFLASLRFPDLVDLALPSACLLDGQLVEAIVTSPIVARLRSLDLSGGSLDDREVSVLIDERARLSHLAALDVSRNHLEYVPRARS